MRIILFLTLPWIASCLAASAVPEAATKWEVPMGGNAYLTSGVEEDSARVDQAGLRQWNNEKSVFSVWFRVDRPAKVHLGLRLKVPKGESLIRAVTVGRNFEKKVMGDEDSLLGEISVKKAGYVRVDLHGIRKQGEVFADVSDLLVASSTPDLKVDFVKDNESNRFYWGHRGPSIHLGYEAPAGKTVEWFYNEVTVPEGQDPMGSYFMASGFSEGYFGMQVNGEKERRVLFSVWSPFTTDDPKAIPDDHKVKLLAKGEGVHGGEFGGEGSGGQSFLIYPWKAGITYRFLNRARPDGKGHTNYTAWFWAPEMGKWQLIASFQRPKTDKYLTGMHSFLENFADRQGYHGRMAYYGNQWARDTSGVWTELTKAHFTGDDIASRGFRLDYAGGTKKDKFFLHNGGYFAENVALGKNFEREPSDGKHPVIDFDALEGVE